MQKDVTLNIDGQSVTVPAGTTVLETAAQLGIEIPTLCHMEGMEPFTSCFMCVVDIKGHPDPVPSCSTVVAEGMKVHTQSSRIIDTRKIGIELLLSDHCGDCVAPCSLACPAGCNIQKFIKQIAEGHNEEAIKTIKETLPMPGALGRICTRPCEDKCRRVRVEEPLAIGALHRFAADEDARKGRIYCPDPGGEIDKESSLITSTARKSRHVAVIGAGPAGMAAAYFLRLKGHDVTVFEARNEPGGMLRWGIPAYRLPREQLRNELMAIVAMGVEMRYNQVLARDFSLADLKKQGFDAIFIAIGAPLSAPLRIDGEHVHGVIGGIEFLNQVANKETIHIGHKVIVVGGGNTAIDAVRTAHRLGVADVILLYRRTRTEMPASASEIDEAEYEGVQFQFLSAPVRICESDKAVSSPGSSHSRLYVHCQQMQLGEPDASGRRRPVPIPGKEFVIEADTVIAAIGQGIDAEMLRNAGVKLDARRKRIAVNPDTLQTDVPYVFAGGDAVAREDQKIAVWAVGSGNLAATSIDQFLSGKPVTGQLPEFSMTMGKQPEQVSALRFAGIEKVARVKMHKKKPEECIKSFCEVEHGLTAQMACSEARRCLACGCSVANDCLLRKYALEYGADQNRFQGAMREYTIDTSYPDIILEQGKCINCGICTRMDNDDDKQGIFGFVERGFDTRVKPYFETLSHQHTADFFVKYADACPTGAIVKRSDLGQHISFPCPDKTKK